MLAKIRLSTVLFGAVAICVIVGAKSSAAAPQQRYSYRIDDSIYGEIGTYSNVVEMVGDTKTITTEAHIKVSLASIVLYTQDASRIERWVSDRLVYFHGVTTENGQPIEVNGQAEANNFIVVSPSGKATAPGTIRSANPLSPGAPSGDAMLMPDTGLIEKVNASICEETSITTGAASKRVRRCQIETTDGKERYDVWSDDSGTPVMFDIQDSVSTVTFTLVR